MIKEITNFEQEVLNSDKPVVLDFWAEWCSPCRIIAPSMESLSREYENEIQVLKCNVDEHPDLCQQFQIKSIPTVVFFKKGGEVFDRQIGAAPRTLFVKKIELLLM